MTPSVVFARHALLIAASLAISVPVGAQPVKTKAPEKPSQRDPYFMPTAAKSSSTMPRVIIRNMREDRAGNIWFATFGGPIRYDGKVFTNFSDEVGLPNTRIFSLLEDRSGALWFGSITGGASRYDGKSFTKFTEKEGLANNDVTWIFEDRDAKIWFGTANGVSRYDGKSMTNFTTKDGLVHNSVYAIAQDASGRIWFGTQGGVCSYDGKSFANLADQVGRSFVNVRAIAVDRSGNLWFGGQEGAFRYDGKTLSTFTTKEGLLDDFVGSMIVDRAGNLWLGHPGRDRGGSGGGASRYDGKSFKHFTQKDGLNSTNVYCMLEDKAGNIWFGSVDAGACRYDGKTFTNFSATDRPSAPTNPQTPPRNEHKSTMAKGAPVSELSKSIWSVFQDKNGNHWFGSNGQGVYRYDGKTLINFTTNDGLADNQIRGIQEDKSGNIYVNTVNGISKFDGDTFTTLTPSASRSPMTEWKLQPDDLWFAGAQNSGAVYRYDGKTLHALEFPKTKRGDEHYVAIPRSKNPNAKYSPYDVYTIYRDRKGHLWFGTAALGVCRFDGKSFDWLYEDHLTNPPGGGSFGIRSIIEDKEGKFWFCNTRYRYTISPHNSAGNGSISYKQEKGMGDLKALIGEDFFYFPSIVEDNKGDLWMATYRAGVWRFDGTNVTQFPVKDGSKNAWIVSITKDARGDLWLGTNESGAYKFNGTTFDKFRP
jgi:ligand-binding sensor domain-containing protein